MNVVLFSGSHNRHLYLHQALTLRFNIVGIVLMERENVNPVADASWPERNIELFNEHFRKRSIIETKYFGHLSDSVFNGLNLITINRSELNSEKVKEFVTTLNADVAVIFGVDIIKDPVFSILPVWKINVHLGLSPWYKGAATLFWPFYYLEPQYSGATIHLIAPKADAGEILHHSIPELVDGHTMHEHSANVVVKATLDIIDILEKVKNGVNIVKHKQRSSGKLFLEKEFRPEHLEVVYNLHNDDIIGKYLRGYFTKRNLNLISHNQDSENIPVVKS